MNDLEKHFVGILTRTEFDAEEFTQRETARDTGLATMRAELDTLVVGPDGTQIPLRESIRAGMTFHVVDAKGKAHGKSFSKDGQEHEIDTEAAVRKGYGLSSEDQARVQKAMEQALGLVEKLRALTGPAGQPLYDEADLMEEVFTPLTREGLLPDNLVIDQYSATNQLLTATFGRYDQALKNAEKARRQKSAKIGLDAAGMDGGKGKGMGKLGRAKEIKNEMQARLMAKYNLTQDDVRRIKLGATLVRPAKRLESDLAELFAEIPASDIRELLAPIAAAQAQVDKVEEALGGGSGQGGQGDQDSDGSSSSSGDLQTALQQQQAAQSMDLYDQSADVAADEITDDDERADWLQAVSDTLSDLADKVEDVGEVPLELWDEVMQSQAAKFTEAAMLGIEKIVVQGKHAVTAYLSIKKKIKRAEQARIAEAALRQAVRGIDAGLVEALTAVDPATGMALSGHLAKRFNWADAIEAATGNAADGVGLHVPPNGKSVVEAFAKAIEALFANAAPPADPPSSLGASFTKMGAVIAAGLRAKVNTDQLSAGLKKKPMAALVEVIKAATTAASKELGAAGGTDAPTDAAAAAEFKKQATTPANQKALIAISAVPDPDAAAEEMDQADEETRSYEDSLMLIDEGGVDAAQTRNIENLILELKRNRKILETVAGLGKSLFGAGGKIVKVVGDVGVGGPLVDAFRTAKLIVQLSVNVKKAADRWVLWYKFRSSLEHSKKARSALTSTIQGFFNNKREQIAFHTIEDAMIALQIAFTIVGSVPEPITMGVGKTGNLVASSIKLANHIAGKVYNEMMLTEAWTTTVAAMNNPADRDLGLAALRLNPTLGMHALAWAGGERQPPDPIARMVMDRLGINAQTIAAGATGDDIKNYLRELLHEDRDIERSAGMDDRLPDTDLEWMPPKFTLCARDFFTITRRAATKAAPKLQLGNEKSVLDALKVLDSHNLDLLAPLAELGDIPPEEMTKEIEEATFVQTALKGYSPRCADGTVHKEMSNVVAEFLSRASTHVNRLEAIEDQNERARRQATDAVQAELGKIASLPDDADEPTLSKQIAESSAVYHQIVGRRVLADGPDLKGMIRQLDSNLQQLRDRALST